MEPSFGGTSRRQSSAMSRLSVALHIGRVEADMQKVIAVFLASLLFVPALSFAQESNDGRTIGQGTVATAPIGTLRESAIRQARLAVANDSSVQGPQKRTRFSRHSLAEAAVWGALIGAAAGIVTVFVVEALAFESAAPAEDVGKAALAGASIGLLIGITRF
jgi:cation transporter-like permease